MTVTDNLATPLWTVEETQKNLASTEGLVAKTLTMDGADGITTFSLPSGWNIGLKDKEGLELTEAKVGLQGTDYTLSKEAILACAHAVGIPPAYVAKTPGVMIQSHLNYWATHSPDISLKLLTKGDTVLAVTKEGIKPFPNLELLDAVLERICERYDITEDLLDVDFKSHHDLHATSLRIIIPKEARQIDAQRNSEAVEDMWSAGIQIRNSLTGKVPLSVQGYLFGWSEATGAVMQTGAGRYNRKIMGQDLHEVLEWVRTASDNVMKTFDHEFDVLSTLTEESIADSVAAVLADTFRSYKIPLRLRQAIMDNLTEAKDFTYYGLVRAISKSANDPGLPEHFVTTVLEVAGDLINHAHERCGNCKRSMV